MNVSDPHGLMCLNAWSLVGGTVLKRIRGCGLVGGSVSLEMDFEVSKAHTSPVSLTAASWLFRMYALSYVLSIPNRTVMD